MKKAIAFYFPTISQVEIGGNERGAVNSISISTYSKPAHNPQTANFAVSALLNLLLLLLILNKIKIRLVVVVAQILRFKLRHNRALFIADKNPFLAHFLPSFPSILRSKMGGMKRGAVKWIAFSQCFLPANKGLFHA